MAKRMVEEFRGFELYFKGDVVELTGEVEMIYGGEFAIGTDELGRTKHIAIDYVKAQVEVAQ